MKHLKQKETQKLFTLKLSILAAAVLLTFALFPAKGYAASHLTPSGSYTGIPGSHTTITGPSAEIVPDAAVEAYTIYYETDGGMFNSWENPFSYQRGVGVASFADAKKEGYTFDGWYADSAYSVRIYSISSSDIGAKTLYAKYIPNTYEIDYELSGGSNASSNPASYQYGTGVASFDDAKKEGYLFEGWYTDKGYTIKVTALTGTDMGDKTLYAAFTPCSYAINYVTKEGAFNENNPSEYVYGTGVDSFSDASLSEYTFEGWFLDEEFTNKVVSIPADTMGDITLYAKFTAVAKATLTEPVKDTSDIVVTAAPLETTSADTDENKSKFSDYLWILFLFLLLLILIIIISIIARKVQKSKDAGKSNSSETK